MSFSDKVVIVTGASGTIGAATAEKFAKLSADLSIVGRNLDNLKKTAAACKNHGAKVHIVAADLTNEEDVKRVVKETVDTFGRIDVLINNAGLPAREQLKDGLEPFDKVMNINVRAVYQLIAEAAPHLTKTRGSIVNVSSAQALRPTQYSAPYHISKAALDMLTKCAALELAPAVRVNSVNPGYIRTDILKSLGLQPEEREAVTNEGARDTPLQRVSDPEELVDLIVYLAGDLARGMTGSIVISDNGYLLTGPNNPIKNH